MNQPSHEILENAYKEFLNGWATGDWQSFLNVLNDNLIFQYPAGVYKGRHLAPEGRPKMTAWVHSHSEVGDRIQITPTLKVFQNDWGVFCATSIGKYNGEPYDGNEIYFLRVRGNQIIEYREYIGDIVGWLSDIS